MPFSIVVALTVTDATDASRTLLRQKVNVVALIPPTVLVFVSAMIACKPLIWFVNDPAE